MRKRLAIPGAFLVAALWSYFWEFVRSWIYEGVLGMIEPYIPPYDAALHYGPSAALALVGVWLFFRVKPSQQVSATTQLPQVKANARAKIIFGTNHPFKSIETAGVNRRSVVRVEVQNESDAHISNGTVRITDLDPPDENHKSFFLKSDISLPAHEATFIDVAYHDIGSSQAKPGRSMRLCVPVGAAYFDRLPGTLPLEPHTFYLEFSTVQNRVLDRVYCRLFLDNGILRLVDGAAAPQNISLHEAAVRLYEAAEEYRFLDFLVGGVEETAEKRLEHVKHQLIVDERIDLSGIRSPSTKSHLIPRDELTFEMFPGAGSTIIDIHSNEIIWHDVSMPVRGLNIVIENFIEHAKKHGRADQPTP